MCWFKRLKWWVTRKEFICEIQMVIREIETEQQRTIAGEPGPASVEQLDTFLRELATVQAQVSSGPLPPLSKRWLSSAWAVRDSWPFDNPLGDRILDLESLYKKLV